MPSWLVSIFWLGVSPLSCHVCFTSVIFISPVRILSVSSCLQSFLPSLVFLLYLFSFHLTHSLTLMHASLLENGCTSLPGESFMRMSALVSHETIAQKLGNKCPSPAGYNYCHTGSDLPEWLLGLICLQCANDCHYSILHCHKNKCGKKKQKQNMNWTSVSTNGQWWPKVCSCSLRWAIFCMSLIPSASILICSLSVLFTETHFFKCLFKILH